MVRRDGAEVRRERIQDIAKNLQRLLLNHNELQLSKVFAGLQYEYGLTKAKLTEYLEILQGLGQFVLDRERDKIIKASEGNE